VINHKVIHLKELPDQPTPVQFTGTGCLMVLKDLLGDVRFGVEWNHGPLRSTGHDWVFCWRLYERDTPVVLVPSVVCRHHKTATEWF
jgi:GT2 family glycosyltransferase